MESITITAGEKFATIKDLVKEDINGLPDAAIGAVREFVLFQKARYSEGGIFIHGKKHGGSMPFHVDREWLASMKVNPNAVTAEELIRADRDARG